MLFEKEFGLVVTAACQDPLSTGISRQEYWSGLPFPTPGDISDPGIEPAYVANYDNYQKQLGEKVQLIS